VGPGWNPVNPAGNLSVEVFRKLAKGEELLLPNLGMETLHHVHADDVAQGFMQALTHRKQSIGESFHIVSPKAITMRGYATAMAEWFGQQALLKFVPWQEWQKTVSVEDARITWDHLLHSPSGSIEKARQLLHYQPGYTSLQAVQESVKWLIDNGRF
jgi:nucleoside-diphosphate-sugar epimerase